MKSLISFFRHFLSIIYKLLFRYSEAVLLVIVVLVTLQVFMRKVPFLGSLFGGGFVWTEEVSLVFVVWMAFISMAIGVAENLHISISMFYEWFPKPLQKAADYLTSFLVMCVGFVLMYYGWLLVQFTRASTLPTTKWPSFILYLMIPVSGFYIVYFSFLRLYRLATGTDTTGKSEESEVTGS